MLDGMGAAMRGERKLWEALFGELAESEAETEAGLADMFGAPSGMLADLLAAQTGVIRKQLAVHTFYALELHQALLKAQPRWEDACREVVAVSAQLSRDAR